MKTYIHQTSIVAAFLLFFVSDFGRQLCGISFHFVGGTSNQMKANLVTDFDSGQKSYEQALIFYEEKDYLNASNLFWRALLLYSKNEADYTIEQAFQLFMSCYRKEDRLADGYAFIADEYLQREAFQESKDYAEMALKVDRKNKEARRILTALGENMDDIDDMVQLGYDDDDDMMSDDEFEKDEGSAEEWYNKGNAYFAKKKMQLAIDAFEKACEISNRSIPSACTNAIYCRTNIANWGPNGEDFEKDMQTLKQITAREIRTYRYRDIDGSIKWHRYTSVHPHMSLGYPWEDAIMKRMVAESYAMTDAFYGVAEVTGVDGWREELKDYPLDQTSKAAKYKYDRETFGAKIKVGYLCVGVNSKAVMFLAQDLFRFHDKSKFETHVLSTGEPDNDTFIQITMRGVDWRNRVQENSDYFHDIRHIRKRGPTALAKYISDLGIHILVDWDGYARQGLRAQGLYYLRPAPVQVMHQEFLGTSGGGFDYIVTDKIVSPLDLQDNYAEKFLYMPHHFFCKGHRMQSEVVPPALEYLPKTNPYIIGTGSPQENNCGNLDSRRETSFVYCNFNKFLKFSPDMFRTWLRILEQVPDSSLCLLAYPMEGVANLLSFVHNYNPDLLDRVGFLPWENNPFDHQQRSRDYCNAVLDSYPYNGHTTSMDALYAGVPIITRFDGEDMSSRVVASANIILDMPELNAKGGIEDYERIGIRLGTDKAFHKSVREKLVEAALMEENGMHVFWDMERYTKNLEKGFEIAWEKYLNGEQPDHITVIDDEMNVDRNEL